MGLTPGRSVPESGYLIIVAPVVGTSVDQVWKESSRRY